MFTDILSALTHITLADVLDILLVAFILYSFFRLIKDTRAYQMAIGIAIIGLFYLITQWAKLIVSHRLIKSFTTYFIIAIIVLFQGEIRRLLTGLGSRTFRRPFSLRSLEEKLEDLFLAVEYLSQKRIGAFPPAAFSRSLPRTAWERNSWPGPGTLPPWAFPRRRMRPSSLSPKRRGASRWRRRATWPRSGTKTN
jgi:hypothetical protein